jgi:hypothetical protein
MRRRWHVAARRKNAYVWQNGRFPDDVEFWTSRLSASANVKPVKEGECLRFFLESASDFEAFHQAATQHLAQTVWTTDDDEVDNQVEE